MTNPLRSRVARPLCLSALFAIGGCGGGGGSVDSGPPPGDDASLVDAGALPCPEHACPMPPDLGPAPVCPPEGSRPIVEVAPGSIDTEVTWTCESTYRLSGLTYVRDGGVLNIGAGTRVIGESQVGNPAALLVTTSGRIEALGHPQAPIVFTSALADPDRGDWAGVVLLGRAPINVAGGTNRVEGVDPADPSGEYGGSDAAHSCGTLRFVRIEWAGYELSPLNELNGLTVAGCGTGTVLDYVQIHKGDDDGLEFFGGTASARHIVVSSAADDSLDWDLGWQGTVQFAVLQQGESSVLSDFGIEADNNDVDNDATPRSMPVLYNVTMVGTNDTILGDERGIFLRRGTHATLRNFIVTGFPDVGARVDDAASESALETGALSLRSSLFFLNGVGGSRHIETGPEMAAFTAPQALNTFDVDPRIVRPFDRTDPDFRVPADAPTVCGAETPPAPFDTSAAYMGAIGPGCDDWTAGWTAYP